MATPDLPAASAPAPSTPSTPSPLPPDPAELYERALLLDPANRPAAFNLAALLLRRSTPGPDGPTELGRRQRRRALDLLVTLRPDLRRPQSDRERSQPATPVPGNVETVPIRPPADTYWYRVTYLLAVDALESGDTALARRFATELVVSLERVLATPATRPWTLPWTRRRTWRPEGREAVALREFAATVEDECLLLYAGVLLQAEGRCKGGFRAVHERPVPSHEALSRHLPTMTAREVQALIVRRPGDPRRPLGGRAHYNLACLRAEALALWQRDLNRVPYDQEVDAAMDDAVDEAVDEVVAALRLGQPVPIAWVHRDPSLAPLRADRRRWARVEETVARLRHDPPGR